jgi:transcriptional regulator with XRE-family HTH domain
MATFGERVARQRERRGWTQRQLAEAVKVSTATINRIENGAHAGPRMHVLKALAQALGCTTDYLVGMQEDEDSEYEPAAVGQCATLTPRRQSCAPPG